MNKTKKILRSLVVVGVVGAVATAGAFSAFSGQTDNPNNQITAGTVDVQDNDANGALYSIATAKPNDPKESCIEVEYTGSLPADIKMYRVPGALGSLGPYANLKVEYGTQASPSFPSCTGFNSVGTLYDADLPSFATTYARRLRSHSGRGRRLGPEREARVPRDGLDRQRPNCRGPQHRHAHAALGGPEPVERGARQRLPC